MNINSLISLSLLGACSFFVIHLVKQKIKKEKLDIKQVMMNSVIVLLIVLVVLLINNYLGDGNILEPIKTGDPDF